MSDVSTLRGEAQIIVSNLSGVKASDQRVDG
jgi:hypothetical protein